MPQKRIRKTPIILAAMLVAVLALSALLFWSVYGNTAPSLLSAADISPSQIEFATVRVRDENGALRLKKISSENEISRLCDSLSQVDVEKRLSFGTDAESSFSSISLKLKGKSGLVRLSGSGNCFKRQNSGLLSPFFVCYYDVTDGNKFSELINSFAI
ncbi:MAG: hypothetical protein UHH95_04620 [Oscillospiraceae bacterium]|nr:hypothetical protein [Oscillospiraceae bacterium]